MGQVHTDPGSRPLHDGSGSHWSMEQTTTWWVRFTLTQGIDHYMMGQVHTDPGSRPLHDGSGSHWSMEQTTTWWVRFTLIQGADHYMMGQVHTDPGSRPLLGWIKFQLNLGADHYMDGSGPCWSMFRMKWKNNKSILLENQNYVNCN